LVACFVTYPKVLLLAMLPIQKLGCLLSVLCELPKSFAGGCVTYSKAWLPAL
jgi:hypothetical protein